MARSKSPKKNGNSVEAPNSTESVPSKPIESLTEVAAPSGPATQVAKPRGRNGKKPEVIKTDSRVTLVPINLDDEIRRLAYLMSEQRGFEPGHETEDWLNAEREVLGRYEQQRA